MLRRMDYKQMQRVIQQKSVPVAVEEGRESWLHQFGKLLLKLKVALSPIEKRLYSLLHQRPPVSQISVVEPSDPQASSS